MIEAGLIEADRKAHAQHGRAVARGRSEAHRIELIGCPVDVLDLDATVDRCLELAENGYTARQVSVNAAKLAQFSRDPEMAEFVRTCDVISADGQAVVWAARVLGESLPGRVPGIDLMQELIARAEDRQLGVYFLGAREEALERAVARIRAAHPRLRVVGSHHGYFSPEEEVALAAEIRDAAPELLFIAMSSPRKEQWLDRNAEILGVPFSMGVGGALDVLAGERTRAPAWMQSAGLEWLHRLLQEPRRMWRRYLFGNLSFVWLVIRARSQRLRGIRQDG